MSRGRGGGRAGRVRRARPCRGAARGPRGAGRRRRARPAGRARTRRCGARTPRPRRRSGSAGSTPSGAAGSCCPSSPSCATSWPTSTTWCSPAWAARRWRPRSSPAPSASPLTVLDTTDPHQVRAALADRLDRTRRGGGQQVRLHGGDRQPPPGLLAGVPRRRADRGRGRPALRRRHRPGLAAGGDRPRDGRARGPRRPRGRRPLQRADRVRPGAVARWPGSTWPSCSTRPRSSAASLGRGRRTTRRWRWARRSARPPLAGRDKVALVDDGTGIVGLGDWAEQLHRRVDRQGRHGHPAGRGGDARQPRRHRRRRAHRHGRRRAAAGRGARRRRRPDVAVNGPLGAQFLAWEYATAVAGRVLGINPFDQPNVDRDQGEHQPHPRPRACPASRRRSPRARSRCTPPARRADRGRRCCGWLLDGLGRRRATSR